MVMNEYSRRAFLGSTAAASAALALGVITEPMLAAQDLQPPHVEGGVLINANENPLGPCAAARTALTNIIPQAGRYRFDLRHDLMETFASSLGLKSDQVLPFAGSSEPLHFTIIAYTSPTKSFVNAN